MKKTVTTEYKIAKPYKYKLGKTTFEGKVESCIILENGKLSQVEFSEHWTTLRLRNLKVLKLFTKVFLKTLRKLDELEIIDINDYLP